MKQTSGLSRLGRLSRLLALPLVLGLLLAACGGGGDTNEGEGSESEAPEATESAEADPVEELVAAAQEEGQLTFYTAAADAVSQELAKAFTEEYGIEVNVLRLATGELTARFVGEAEAGVHEGDVVVIASPELFTTHEDLWREPGDLPNLEAWPSSAKKGVYAVTAMGEHVMGYNTELVSEEDRPKKWEDLLDPKWKGKGVMLDPRSSPTYLSWAKHMRDEYGDEFLTKLAEQDFDLVDSGVSGAQQVAAGAKAFVVPNVPGHNQQLIDQGAPMKIGTFEELNHGVEHYVALPAESPNQNAGALFMNWLLSVEAQEIYCEGVYASHNPDAQGCWPAPKDFIPSTYFISDEEKAEILGLLGLS